MTLYQLYYYYEDYVFEQGEMEERLWEKEGERESEREREEGGGGERALFDNHIFFFINVDVGHRGWSDDLCEWFRDSWF